VQEGSDVVEGIGGCEAERELIAGDGAAEKVQEPRKWNEFPARRIIEKREAATARRINTVAD
jgi:hypothetical protein